MCALGWGVIPLILIEGLGNLVHAVGWRYCIDAPAPQVPLLRLFRMSLAGWAINYLTPSASLGGEVTKAALLASTPKGPEAVSSVLLDKLTSAIGPTTELLGRRQPADRVLFAWCSLGVPYGFAMVYASFACPPPPGPARTIALTIRTMLPT